MPQARKTTRFTSHSDDQLGDWEGHYWNQVAADGGFLERGERSRNVNRLYRFEGSFSGYERDRFWAGSANGITSGRLPSEQFRAHVFCTFMRDHTAVRDRHEIGLHNILWSSDFPHQDRSWPHSRQIVAEHFCDVPLVDQQRIARDNAIDLYQLPLERAAARG